MAIVRQDVRSTHTDRRRSGRRRRLARLAAALAGAALAAGALAGVEPRPAGAQGDAAAQVIAEVNALRAGYGLPPLTVDPILMAVARAHNDWRVATGQITHIGPDGSRPRDRAIAAGYGGGRTVFVSENIIGGTGLSVAGAMEWWRNSSIHLNTMIGPHYRDIGAAYGQSGGMAHYTLITGYVAGAVSAQSTVPSGSVPGYVPAAPVVRATPDADGSIVHEVLTGQTLWTIGAVYEVDVEILIELNDLGASALLHPGDRLLIVPAPTPTATATATATATRTPAPTHTPNLTPSATVTPTPSGALGEPLELSTRNLVLIGAGLALGLGGVILGMRRPTP